MTKGGPIKGSQPPSGLWWVPAGLNDVRLYLSVTRYCLEPQCKGPPAAQDQDKDQDKSLPCRGQIGVTLCSQFLKGQSPKCCWPPRVPRAPEPTQHPPRDTVGSRATLVGLRCRRHCLPLASHSQWGPCHILGRKEREACWRWRWGGVLLTPCLPSFHAQYCPCLVPVSPTVLPPAPRSGGGLHLPWASRVPSPTRVLKFPCSGTCDLIKG